MTRFNLTNMKNRAKTVGKRAAAAGTALVASGAAMAQTSTEIIGVIDAQKVLALAVVVAGTLAILAIKYSKMARRA